MNDDKMIFFYREVASSGKYNAAADNAADNYSDNVNEAQIVIDYKSKCHLWPLLIMVVATTPEKTHNQKPSRPFSIDFPPNFTPVQIKKVATPIY